MQKLSFDVDAYVDTVSLEEVGQAAVQDIEVVTVALAREGKEAKRTMTAPVPIVHSRAHVDQVGPAPGARQVPSARWETDACADPSARPAPSQTLRFTVTLYRSATGAWEEKVYRVMVEAKDFKGAVNVLGSADLNIPDHVAEKAPSSPLVLHVPQCGEVKIVLRVQAHVEGEAEVAQRRGSDELKLAAHHHAAAAAHAEEHNHHASGGYDHQARVRPHARLGRAGHGASPLGRSGRTACVCRRARTTSTGT